MSLSGPVSRTMFTVIMYTDSASLMYDCGGLDQRRKYSELFIKSLKFSKSSLFRPMKGHFLEKRKIQARKNLPRTKDMKVFTSFTLTFKTVCSVKENMEAGPNQVGKSMGMCRYSLNRGTKPEQERRPSAFCLSYHTEPEFLQQKLKVSGNKVSWACADLKKETSWQPQSVRWVRSHKAFERGHLPTKFCAREGSGIGFEGG